MGQTLSHGVYLPNEGERNCYAGLASNWQILNTAVGNIAEKAPLVHTHGNISNDGKVGTTANVPLITGTGGVVQAGSFGNQANTFCEGNDSRLSDARTPVAHTHGKADITDLFNSANTWSGYNTFTSYIALKENAAIPAGSYGKGIVFRDYQNNRLGYIQPHVTSDSEKRLLIGADAGNVATNSSLIPHVNNSYNLGTSTNKWKTFNGINPGALSLPDMSSGTGVSLSAGSNSYSPPSSGWLSINLTGAISVVCGNFCHSGTDMLSVPVVKGSTYTVTVATSGTAYLFVSQGNV